MLPRLALGRNLRREEGTHGGECEGAHCSSAGAGVYRSPLKTGGGTLAAAVPGPQFVNRRPPVSRTFCCQGATPSIKYTDALRVDMSFARGNAIQGQVHDIDRVPCGSESESDLFTKYVWIYIR